MEAALAKLIAERDAYKAKKNNIGNYPSKNASIAIALSQAGKSKKK
jgi:hypothetical protein